VGIVGLVKMKKDEFPTFTVKTGLVIGVYPGASPQEVEKRLTIPLEKMLATFPEVDLKTLRSYSCEGMCYMYVDLNCPNNDVSKTWDKIRTYLDAQRIRLPKDVLAVKLVDDFCAFMSHLIVLTSDDKSYIELQDYADELCDRLRGIPNLKDATVVGRQTEEIAVVLDREKLAAYALQPSMLTLGYQAATLSMPAGTFETDYTSAPIHLHGNVDSECEISNRIVYCDPMGNTLRLKDVAKVERRYKKPTSFISYQGNECVVLAVEMRKHCDIVAFGKEVDKVVDAYQKEMPPSVHFNRIADQPKLVAGSVTSFLRDLLISMLVVILVMMMMFPLRSALIAASGVPIGTAMSIAVMYIVGIDLNTVTLAGLIVVLGMIVDNSIITMDGYISELRIGKSPLDAVRYSIKNLFAPTLAATLAISAMFFPLEFTLSGILGDFVKLFPFVVAFALIISFIYAFSVVPSLEVRYIKLSDSSNQNAFARAQQSFFDALQRLYDKGERLCFRHPHATMMVGVGVVVLGVVFCMMCNVQMMPKAARDYFAIEIALEGDNNIDDTQACADSLSKILVADPRIVSVTSFIGSGAPCFSATYSPVFPGVRVAQLLINTHSAKETSEVIQYYEHRCKNLFPQAIVRIKQMDYQAVDAPVVVMFSGDNRDSVAWAAEKVKAYMCSLDEDLQWVHSTYDNVQSVVDVTLIPEAAAQQGVNRTSLALSMAGAFGGQNIGSIWEDDTEIPINLYSDGVSGTMDYATIGNQMVRGANLTQSVPLRQVAQIEPSWQHVELSRCRQVPTIAVSADLCYGKSQPHAVSLIKQFVEQEGLASRGVDIRYDGLDIANKDMIPEVIVSVLACIMVLVLFMLFHFKKFSLTVLTLGMSLLCFFGAFLGLWLFDIDIGLTAVLGIVSLVSIFVRNGIIMYDYAEELRSVGMSLRDAAFEAGRRRMQPIFLTSATTALGVLPMVLSGDMLWQPMGVVILFGIVFSIALIVLVMPVGYWMVFKDKPKSDDAIKYATTLGIVVGFLFLVPMGSQAQEGRVPRQLNLSQCLSIAHSNSHAIKGAQYDVSAAKAVQIQARTLYYPQALLMGFGYNMTSPLVDIDMFDYVKGSAVANSLSNILRYGSRLVGLDSHIEEVQNGYGFIGGVVQPIYMGGRIRNGNKLADLNVDAKQLQLQVSERDADEKVEDAYWELVSLQEKQQLVEQGLRDIDTLVEQVRVAYRAGIVLPSDTLTVMQKRNEIKILRRRLLNGIRLAKMNLLGIMGMEYSPYVSQSSDSVPYIGDISVEPLSAQLSQPSIYYYDEEQVVDGQPEIMLLNKQVEAYRLQRQMALGEALPSFLVVGEYGYGKLIDHSQWSGAAMAVLSVPITDWGRATAKMREQTCAIQKAETSLEYYKDQ
ncbi:MAG: efflux RND transporter permease subunit, partial [Bacteroidales bacterium]|nr:efflux RND transporter permease subunit [Candidatus Colimorpha onthohippi]